MEQHDKELQGWTRNVGKKEVRKWIEENLSDKARFDLRLTQLNNGEYVIRMYWLNQGATQ